MKILAILLIFPILFFSCGEDSSTQPEEDPIITMDNYNYPINLGNNWIYEGNYVVEFLGDTPSEFEDLDFLFTNIVIIDSIYNEVENIYRFKTFSIEEDGDDEDLFVGYQYFSNSDDGLYYHGRTASGSLVVPWSRGSEFFYKINNEIYPLNELLDFLNHGIIGRDNECWEALPLLSISYPVDVDDQWIYREFSNDCDPDTEDSNPFRMGKLVFDKGDETFTIQTLYDIVGNGAYDEDEEFVDSNSNGVYDEDEEFIDALDGVYDEGIAVYHTYSINGLINYRIEANNQMMVDEVGNELGLVNTYFSHELIGSEIY